MAEDAFEKALRVAEYPELKAALQAAREYGQCEVREPTAAAIGWQSTMNQLEEVTAQLKAQQRGVLAVAEELAGSNWGMRSLNNHAKNLADQLRKIARGEGS